MKKKKKKKWCGKRIAFALDFLVDFWWGRIGRWDLMTRVDIFLNVLENCGSLALHSGAAYFLATSRGG